MGLGGLLLLRVLLGLHRHGGHAELMSCSVRYLHHTPSSISDDDAATAEPLAVAIHGVRLLGDAGVLPRSIAIFGAGTIGLEDQDTHLDFHVDLARLNQVLPAVVDEIPKAVSNQLLTLRVRGKPGNLRIDKQLLPVLNDPLRRLAEAAQP